MLHGVPRETVLGGDASVEQAHDAAMTMSVHSFQGGRLAPQGLPLERAGGSRNLHRRYLPGLRVETTIDAPRAAFSHERLRQVRSDTDLDQSEIFITRDWTVRTVPYEDLAGNDSSSSLAEPALSSTRRVARLIE